MWSILKNNYCVNGIVRSRSMGHERAERKKVNVLEIKCVRSLLGFSRMDRVRNA